MKIVLDKDAIMPTRGHDTDAGLDLYSRVDAVVGPNSNEIFDIGVHIELPPNTCGMLVSKSGLNVNHDITSTGLIDEGYTGSIKVKLYNHGDTPYHIYKGDKISQLLIVPFVKAELEETDTLETTERGNNGFGSTGK